MKFLFGSEISSLDRKESQLITEKELHQSLWVPSASKALLLGATRAEPQIVTCCVTWEFLKMRGTQYELELIGPLI